MPPYSIVTVPPATASRPASMAASTSPPHPIIPFIGGDGTGPDIRRPSHAVFDAAVQKPYGSQRRIAWMEVIAGEKAFNRFKDWRPEDTVNYVCLRPVRWFAGVPSPVKCPEQVDMVIFPENTEDIYAGIEWPAESAEARKLIAFLQGEMGVRKIRFPATSGTGVKPVSREGTERLARAAIDYALRHQRRSLTSCTRATS